MLALSSFQHLFHGDSQKNNFTQQAFRIHSAISLKMLTMTEFENTGEARLLVVDDEPNIRDLLASSLRFAGFDVITAEDGASAYHQAQEERPDLIVLDVMLPDMDGFTVTRRLRDAGITIPVLFLTARDDMRDKIQGLTVGGDDYVTKPFGLEEVVARIRAVLWARAATMASCASLTLSSTKTHTKSLALEYRSTCPPPSSSFCATS